MYGRVLFWAYKPNYSFRSIESMMIEHRQDMTVVAAAKRVHVLSTNRKLITTQSGVRFFEIQKWLPGTYIQEVHIF